MIIGDRLSYPGFRRQLNQAPRGVRSVTRRSGPATILSSAGKVLGTLLTTLPGTGRSIYHIRSKRRTHMRKPTRPTFGSTALGFAFVFCAIASASAEDAKNPYPAMAPVAQYLMASPTDEI